MTVIETVEPVAASSRDRVPRPLPNLVLLLVVLGLVVLASLAIGSRPIPVGTVWHLLWQPDDSDLSAIVHSLRIPRTVIGVAVGAALGMAGALMQGHTRNPLADPGLLGISAGAALAVVLGIFAFGVSSTLGYAWFALVGAGLAAVVVFAIGSTRRGPDPVSLVLAGAAVSALLGAFTQAIVLSDQNTLDQYRFWVVGSTAGRDLSVFWQVLPFLAVGVLLAAVSAGGLNLLQLGDDVARSLGLNPLLHKAIGIAAVMLLTGAATAACGPIGFVGLVVPHVARLLSGVDYRWLIWHSAVIGACLLLIADILGRLIALPGEVQAGIVMALIGGPVFVILVRRSRMVKL